MNLDFYHVVSIDKAQTLLSELALKNPLKMKEVSVDEALHRFVAEDVVAPYDLPRFNRSTVDGYAIRWMDVVGASESIPSMLTVVGKVSMGETTQLNIGSCEAVYVPTGGMLPLGCDAVVMIEYTEKLDEDTIMVSSPVSQGENITCIGDDLAYGELLIRKGVKISPYDIGLLVGFGMSKVMVYDCPNVAIISTGDEIIDPGQDSSLGQVYDMNGYALAALVKELGGIVVAKSIVNDDFDALKQCMKECLTVADLILISGGSSVGVRDYTKALIESFSNSRLLIHGLAVKPGKPTLLGTIGEKLIFGLPGHPVSALIVFDALVKYYIEQLQNRSQNVITMTARLTNNVHGAPGRDTFQMVSLEKKDQEWYATPIYAKSGMMSLLAHSSGYFVIPMHKEGYKQDEQVEVFLRQEVRL